MKTRMIKQLLAGCLAAAFSAHLGAVTLSFGDSRSVGLVNDGIPTSESDVAGYINTLLLQPAGVPTVVGTETYTRSTTTDPSFVLGSALVAGAVKQDNSNTTYNLGTGFMYLTGKYDATNAGLYVWYVGGLTGSVTIPAEFLLPDGVTKYGLSNTIAFTPGVFPPAPPPSVPDGGSTVALLGLAFGLIGLMRARGCLV